VLAQIEGRPEQPVDISSISHPETRSMAEIVENVVNDIWWRH
jgi:hypothetical protein